MGRFSVVLRACFFFFFKQKTAYELIAGDWSSDVCSSDLVQAPNFWGYITKKNAKSYDLTFNIWCTSRDSNPGPTD